MHGETVKFIIFGVYDVITKIQIVIVYGLSSGKICIHALT